MTEPEDGQKRVNCVKFSFEFIQINIFLPQQQSFNIFGRDVSKIPCFRNSFLYGISGGVGAGFVAFMTTSRPPLSMHIGMGIFAVTTVCYWFPCRLSYHITTADTKEY